eukprot:2488489-Prymnesium_polylepis.1
MSNELGRDRDAKPGCFGQGSPRVFLAVVPRTGRWPMLSPEAVSERYARPAVPLARDTCR